MGKKRGRKRVKPNQFGGSIAPKEGHALGEVKSQKESFRKPETLYRRQASQMQKGKKDTGRKKENW